MNRILPVILCTLISSQAIAQETKPAAVPAERKNEIGLMGQTNLSGNAENIALMGLQYNRWVTPHLGYRIIGAYGNYINSSATITYAPSPDTIINKTEHLNIHMPIVGAGLTAQRQFYKRVYLFAAMELKGGYGGGNTDTLIKTTYGTAPNGNDSYEFKGGNNKVNMMYLGLSASIGAKLQYSRMCFGIELLPVQMNYQYINYGNRKNSSGNFDLGSFSQRLFVQFRF